MLFHLEFFNLALQDLLMINTNAVRSHVEIIESDLADQRFLPFIFAPGANDFHNESPRAKLMPITLT